VKRKDFRVVIAIVSIFVLGIAYGSGLSQGRITSFQGYMFSAAGRATRSNATNSNATNSNATNSNATNSNATNSNATNSDATNSNATNSNAIGSPSDGVLILESLSLGSATVKPGDKVSVGITIVGAPLEGVSISLKRKTGSYSFVAVADLSTGDPFIQIQPGTAAGSYYVDSVILTGRNSDGSTFTKLYNVDGVSGADKLPNDIPLEIQDSNAKKIELKSISLGSTTAKVSDKVYVNYEASDTLKNLKLRFVDGNNKELNVYVKSLDKKSYFEIPTNTNESTYNLVNAILESSDATTIYDLNGADGAETYAFNCSLTVEAGDDTHNVYNNEDIDNSVISSLYRLKDGSEIVVNAHHSSAISSELYNVIKGTDKKLIINYKENQIIFKGSDVRTPKTIDASIVVGSVESHEEIRELVRDGVLLRFADNGYLPGRALVRIKATDEVNEILGSGQVQVYVFNADTHNFCEVATNIQKTKDGYYEFSVAHNSDYIMVNEPLDDSLVVEGEGDVVSFQKSNNVYLLLIGLGVLAILVVGGILIVNKGKNIPPKNSEKSEEKKEEKKETKKRK